MSALQADGIIIIAPYGLDCFGWEAGTRTPIARSRVWSPTIGRPPSSEFEFTELAAASQLSYACAQRPIIGRIKKLWLRCLLDRRTIREPRGILSLSASSG